MRGEIPALVQTFSELRTGLLLAILIILLLLTANFQSFKLALAIVLTIPAVLAGVLLMLQITGTTLNVQSFMGAIMAIGIAVANSILLVTFAERARHDGRDHLAAAREGASSRLRAILMTAGAMIFGMLPMAIGASEGGSESAPLGRAVIGGLIVSTFTTLTVLPSVTPFCKGRHPCIHHRSTRWTPGADIMKRNRGCLLALLAAGIAWPQTTELVPVISKTISRIIELPGEFQAFQSVQIHARVRGYVERVAVDRGSVVKRGDVLAELTAPEMQAQIAEAESKVQAAESERLQAVAQLAGAQSTSDRLKQAAETPGAIAGNELIQAQKQVEAAQALVESKQQASRAAEAVVRARKALEAYLRIEAPFDGVVTERLVHPGALVGIERRSVAAINSGRLPFAPGGCPARRRCGRHCHGRESGVPRSRLPGSHVCGDRGADPRMRSTRKTRTMAVELDVFNRDGSLSPGMYPAVQWPIRGSKPLLLVPKTSVVTTTERTFVIRDRNGRAEWVDVRKGNPEGDLIAVAGDLKLGDMVVRRANDEIREGDPTRPGKK